MWSYFFLTSHTLDVYECYLKKNKYFLKKVKIVKFKNHFIPVTLYSAVAVAALCVTAQAAPMQKLDDSVFGAPSAGVKPSNTVSTQQTAMPMAPVAQQEQSFEVTEATPSHLNPATNPLIVIDSKAKLPLAEMHDASVFDTMNGVLLYSPSLKSIRESRTAQQYEVEKAKSGYYPSVDLNATLGYGYQTNLSTRTGNLGKSPAVSYDPSGTAGVSVTQILWNGLAVPNSIDYNIFLLESSDNRVYDNATSLALEGLIAHIDLIRTAKVLELSKAYVEKHKEILSQQQALTASGITTNVDVVQAQGSLASAQADAQDAANAYNLAVHNYEYLTGVMPPAHLQDVPMPTQAIALPEEIVRIALAKNPKIKALTSDYNAALEQIELAKADYHPQISLSYNLNYSDPEIDNEGPTQYEVNHGAVLGMSWNIFNGFETKNTVLAAKASSRTARQDTLAQMDSIKSEAKSTYDNMINSQIRQGFYEEALLHNLSTRDSYLSQFAFGTRSLLDVLDAESELYSTQVQLQTVSANVIVNAWRVLALQGTFLDELNITMNTFATPID